MKRAIVSFACDADADWIARLACGHRRHVRHDPPLSERPWVLSEAGRRSRIGTSLDCVACDRSEMPAGHAPYQRTPDFDERTVPDALRKDHSTKAGVWAHIHVTRGALAYHVNAPSESEQRLTPEAPGIVLPEVLHHVAPVGEVSFYVEFWRAARDGDAPEET